MSFAIRPATANDASAIADIYAPIVRETHLSAELDAPSADEMAARIAAPTTHAWLVAGSGNRIAGYAYATQFRTRLAYQWCSETSVYIHADFRRTGVGRLLYADLLDRLRAANFRHAVAVIALPNPPSVAFHDKLGFVPVGVFPKICYKLGRWYDIGWWRLPLIADGGPPSPIPERQS